MFDILVNGKVVAIAAQPVVKIIMSALIDKLPMEVSVQCKEHKVEEGHNSEKKEG